ncbi:MAG: PKD domain-containing protein [Lutibacter sp.]
MKSHHFLTTLKGIFFSFILLLFFVGCSKKDEVEETFTPPVAEFSFTPVSPKVNEAVTFNNTSTNATSFEWSATGTNFSSTEKNPTFTFTTAGDFEVKLIATGEGGSSAKTKQISVAQAAQPTPVAAFSFSPTSPETGQEVTFTNTSTNATSYQWSAAGTTFSSTAENPKFTFATAGDFDVKLVAKNAAGQSNEVAKKVTVAAAQPKPVAAFSFSPTSPEAGQEVTFTNTSTNATSYQWSAAGTTFSSTVENPKFTFATAGDFDVKLVAKNAAGQSNEVAKKVTVAAAQPKPVAAFSFSPTSPEAGQEVTFTNTSTNATSYQWSAAGTTFSSTEKNPKFTFTTAGNFDVKLVATNSTGGKSNKSAKTTGGSSTITKTITVTAAPVAPVAGFSFSPTSPEAGQEVTFTNTSTNATSYQWSAAGTTFSSTEKNPKFTFAAEGDFDVKLVAKNAAGQSSEVVKKVTVKTASGGGNGNPCNLPDCYVKTTTTVSLGFTTTVSYSFTVVNGKKLLSSVTTSSPGGTIVLSFQYNAQGMKTKMESKVGGSLQSYINYTYSNGNRTVRGDSYNAAGTPAGYTIENYDTDMHLTRSEAYTPAGILTGYSVFSDFLPIEGTFAKLVKSYDGNNTLTQTDVHTYQDCQLIKSVSTDGSGTLIGEVNNTLDSRRLLRTSVAKTYTQGMIITSNTQYVYDCD